MQLAVARHSMRLIAALLLAKVLAGCTYGEDIVSSVDRPKPDEPAHGELVLPEGAEEPVPAVVLLHGCGGLRRNAWNSLNAHADALRDEEFATLILDSSGPRGLQGGWICTDAMRMGEARFNRALDAFEALHYLAAQPEIDEEAIFVMGQSQGGTVAIVTSQRSAEVKYGTGGKRYRGAVAFYPWCNALDGSEIDTPLLMLVGKEDDWTPAYGCIVKAEERSDEEPIETVAYDSAHHAFDFYVPVHSYKGYTVGGHAGAREDARERMIAFFKRLAGMEAKEDDQE